jgi:outer membrane protein
MFLSALHCALRRTLAIVLTGALTTAGWAQTSAQPSQSVPEGPQPQRFVTRDYSKPRSYFPNPLGPYRSESLAPPNLSNTPRIEQLMQSGKLMLSMNDAVALALENNLDIAIQRYNLNIADTEILRTKAGASTLGVNSGIVAGTPGGGTGGLSGAVGSGTGGTSAGLGGAGTGTGGLVNSTLGSGPTITSFDPVLSGTLQMDRAYSQSLNIFSDPVVNQNTGTANFSYLQGFQWGTNLSLGFNNTHVTTRNSSATYSPVVSSGLQFKLSQHLLQGFGFAPNTRFIRIAKNNREISDVAFRLQTITTVDQIENMYWDLVFAYENVRVRNESLTFAQKTLSDTKKQVEIGTLAPIEVVRAQSTVATDQQGLTLAQTNLQLQQLLMKNALSRTLVDPRLADAEVIPTSTMQLPQQEPVVPTQDLVNDALTHRAELAEARISLSNTEISNKAVRNSLLPSLDLYAYYGGTGIGGNVALPTCTGTPTPGSFSRCFDPNNAAPPFRNGGPVAYNAALNQLVNSSAPDKGVGLSLTIPIRNRVAQATQIRSELEYRQSQMRLQQLENQIRIEVRQAQFSVQQNRASVASAQAAVDLGHQSLDAEQKKYALGASTTTLVLQNQSALAQAESTLVSAMAAYEKAQLELDRATGLLLDHAGILIADAERGEVTHMPNIPFVAPRKDLPGSVMQPQVTPEVAPPQTPPQ